MCLPCLCSLVSVCVTRQVLVDPGGEEEGGRGEIETERGERETEGEETGRETERRDRNGRERREKARALPTLPPPPWNLCAAQGLAR